MNACVRELAPRPMVKLFSLIEQIEILMYKLINFSKQAFFSEPTSICFPKSYMGQNTQISFSNSHKNNVFSNVSCMFLNPNIFSNFNTNFSKLQHFLSHSRSEQFWFLVTKYHFIQFWDKKKCLICGYRAYTIGLYIFWNYCMLY